MEIINSQIMNENLDHLDPANQYGQYVLVNVDRGSVVWHESYDAAVADQTKYGGVILNTKTTDPELLKLTLANARRNM